MKEAKILFWDLETTDLNADFGTILCAGWKFSGESKPSLISIRDYPDALEKDPTNDYHVVKAFYKVLAKADMWVTWFGEYFDIRMMNSKLAEYKLPPLPPVAHVDGWRIAKYRMRLTSNRLANVSAFLDLEDKTPVKGKVWRRARTGHGPSIKYVEDHCLQDIVVLEQAYERLKPFTIAHPNVGLIVGDTSACPVCGKKGGLQKQGKRVTRARVYQRYQCQKCGAWVRSRTGEKLNVEYV